MTEEEKYKFSKHWDIQLNRLERNLEFLRKNYYDPVERIHSFDRRLKKLKESLKNFIDHKNKNGYAESIGISAASVIYRLYKDIENDVVSRDSRSFNVDKISDSNPCNWKILALDNKNNKKQPAMKTKEYYYHTSIEPVVVLNETRSVPGDPVLSAEDLSDDERLITVEQEHTVKTRLVKKIKRDITLCMLVSEREKYSEGKNEGHYRSYVEIVIGLAIRNPHYDEFDLEKAKEISKGKADKDPIFFEMRDSDVSLGQDIKGLPKQLINGQVANKLLSKLAKEIEFNFGNYVAAFNNE